MKKILTLTLLLLISAPIPLVAQTLTFSASVTSGNGVVSTTLDWSTDPVADSCTAAGHPDFTGTVPPSGSQNLNNLTNTTLLTLNCSFASSDSADLSWVLPTERTDGSTYDNPGSLLILYDLVDSDPLTFMEPIANPMVTSRTIQGMAPGTWEFEAYAIDANGLRSMPSNRATKIISPTVVEEETVTISINPIPLAITDLVVQ